ncbi:MAG TPA: MGMT family protein [Capsulimonadaceae bacterium]|nr:MGMT family protein [Capsulimonadaceae bacterium]
MDDRRHFEAIYEVVRGIPAGYVMSYGQVGSEAGNVSARVVGWAVAIALDAAIPWQRVVGADGYLRIGRRSIALQEQQRKLLELEGVTFLENGCVDMRRHQFGQDFEASFSGGRDIDDRQAANAHD